MSMNLAGDYARACHERIHLNLSKALGLKPVANVITDPNCVEKRGDSSGTYGDCASQRRSAQKGQAGLIPGSMATAGYLVCGKGWKILVLCFSWSRKSDVPAKAKESFTQSALKRCCSQQT